MAREVSPSEEVRRMLDELGIEWRDGGMFHRTHWAIGNTHFVAFEQGGKLYVQISIGPLTPEQAIAATVGAGTCHMEVRDNLAETEGTGDVWLECDECHWQMPLEPTTPRFKHCPSCRRRVVSE